MNLWQLHIFSKAEEIASGILELGIVGAKSADKSIIQEN